MFTDVLDELIGKDDEETSFMNISDADCENISQQQETLQQYTDSDKVSQRERLKRSMVDAWLNEIRFRTEGSLTPPPAIYTEFELDEDDRTMFLKEGRDKNGDRVRLTDIKKNPRQYLAL